MPFTTSGQETEWALFLQPRSTHGVRCLSEDVAFTKCPNFHSDALQHRREIALQIRPRAQVSSQSHFPPCSWRYNSRTNYPRTVKFSRYPAFSLLIYSRKYRCAALFYSRNIVLQISHFSRFVWSHYNKTSSGDEIPDLQCPLHVLVLCLWSF